MREENERLTAHCTSLMDSNAKTETQLSSANNEIEVLKAEAVEFEEEAHFLRTINLDLKVTNDNLNARLEVQRNTIGNFRSENLNLQSRGGK